MINQINKHIISSSAQIKEALVKLDKLGADAILFVVDENNKLLGSLTDGDVRRGLIREKSVTDSVVDFIRSNPKFITKKSYNIQDIIDYKQNNFKIIPVLNEQKEIVNIINFRLQKSYLPIDAVIMAGGRGSRLSPLTDTTPKPLLPVGDKPIIEHNIDNLISYGIDDFIISLRYLGEQIQDYFQDGKRKGVQINYVWENEPLGTAGALKNIEQFENDTILLTNSDLLTTLDYEQFYLDFVSQSADLAILSIPYSVNIPYAILEQDKGKVKSFKEKPTYTYQANGGVYLMKKELIDLIPKNKFYNATDLMEDAIGKGLKVICYPHNGYWLDIGKPHDFEKAQKDISSLNF